MVKITDSPDRSLVFVFEFNSAEFVADPRGMNESSLGRAPFNGHQGLYTEEEGSGKLRDRQGCTSHAMQQAPYLM